MKFKVPKIDLRHQFSGSHSIVDEDTGESVGYISFSYGAGAYDNLRRQVTLFDRYSGKFATHDECIAFVEGIEAVLNHMIAPREKRSESEEAA